PRGGRGSTRLTNWEAKELETLPDAIAEVESQQEALTAELSNPDLYQQNPERAGQINEELAALEEKLEELFDRWESLEAKRAES
ncbi:MAG: ABC transporter ATP-binding protein, partial [Alcaligenaceae bacterium]|nr:ABC transporter ATP-binding protein [Alcaligenaceae bacterium]